MLSETERKELFKKLNDGKKEISRLREELNNLNEQKEAWFRKKSEASKKIAELIRYSKSSKEQRNEFTGKVRELKDERNRFSTGIKDKISELKKLKKEREELFAKLKIKEKPQDLKKEIKKLEYVIETEAISFERERQIMKKIKEIRKKYNEFGELFKIDEKIKVLSRDIDKEKKQESELHKKVQQFAQESQAKHEAMIGSLSGIEALRKEEKEHEAKFLQFKKLFSEKNEELKQKLLALREVGDRVGEQVEEIKEARKRRQRTSIDSKKRAVEEKIKKGQKLTTEDLMVMQHGEED